MSKALDTAELIRTRLLTAPTGSELAVTVPIVDVAVIVDRQKNIVSDVAKAVSKASGTAIVILYDGFRSVDENASSPRIEQRFTVTIYSKPVIAGDNLKADDVMESVIKRLHHWRPVEASPVYDEMRVSGGDLVANASFLTYTLDVTARTSL